MQILSQTEVWRWPEVLIIGLIISGVVLVVALLIMVFEVIGNGVCTKGSTLTASVSFCMLLIMAGSGIRNNMPFCIDYKVLLDDTISAKEFFDKYELLGIDGEIFEIREYINEDVRDEMQRN